MGHLFIVGFIVILEVGLAFAPLIEWYEYHRHYNVTWNHFDTDSQGGRGYISSCGTHTTWCSYPGVEQGLKLPLIWCVSAIVIAGVIDYVLYFQLI